MSALPPDYDTDPELAPGGYPATTFDAEDAAALVRQVFGDVQATRWNRVFGTLRSRAEVRAYCRHHDLPGGRADGRTGWGCR